LGFQGKQGPSPSLSLDNELGALDLVAELAAVHGYGVEMNFNKAIDELTEFGVPEEVTHRLIAELVMAGQQSVYASLGELHGVPAITRAQLGVLIAALIAKGKNDILPPSERKMDPV